MLREEEKQSTLKRNLTIAGSIVAIIAASAFIAFTLFGGKEPVVGVYYFDLNTKKIFVGPATLRAPIDTPSGLFENEPAGVRLLLFSCKPCPNLDGKTLEEANALGATAGWLERYKAEAKKLLDAGDQRMETIMDGMEIRSLTGGKWLSPNARPALVLRETVARLCAGLPGNACTPH